jgi:hypothetical protein
MFRLAAARESRGPHAAGPAAIVVLVEGGEAMIATRPDKAFSYLIGEFGRKQAFRLLKAFQERLP